MPSRADLRSRMEGLVQGIAMAILALLAWRAFGPSREESVRVRDLRPALRRATHGDVAALTVRVDSLPGAVEREWLRAAHDAGITTAWTMADSLPPLAAVVEPAADPLAPARTTLQAPRGAVLRDTVGEVWRGDSSGTAVLDGVVAGGWRLTTPFGTAVPALPSPAPVRRVRVTGAIGWEARFIALALAEAGWSVESDYTLNPGADAVRVRTSGAQSPLDTATHAAVVIVAGAAGGVAFPRELVAWVRSGGGVVLAGSGTVPALDAIAAARAGTRMPGSLGGVNTVRPREGLDAVRLLPRSDAVVVEGRGAAPVVVARREGLGRVLSVGYIDTWHWRMEGGESAPQEHAAWWSGIVASVSRTSVPTTGASSSDPAPLAALHAVLGPPGEDDDGGPLPQMNDRWLLAVAFALLVVGWGSRRTRGLP